MEREIQNDVGYRVADKKRTDNGRKVTVGVLKMRDWKMRDWKIREQETYGTPRVV